MPIYEYKCPKCKATVDKMHSYSDKVEVACEKCKTQMRRMIGGAGVGFSGLPTPTHYPRR